MYAMPYILMPIDACMQPRTAYMPCLHSPTYLDIALLLHHGLDAACRLLTYVSRAETTLSSLVDRFRASSVNKAVTKLTSCLMFTIIWSGSVDGFRSKDGEKTIARLAIVILFFSRFSGEDMLINCIVSQRTSQIRKSLHT